MYMYLIHHLVYVSVFQFEKQDPALLIFWNHLDIAYGQKIERASM